MRIMAVSHPWEEGLVYAPHASHTHGRKVWSMRRGLSPSLGWAGLCAEAPLPPKVEPGLCAEASLPPRVYPGL